MSSPCGKPSVSWPSQVSVSSTPTCPAGAQGSRKAPESESSSPDCLRKREQISRSSNAQALPAAKHTRLSLPGSGLGSPLLLLVLALVGCLPVVEANVRPLLPQGVEPPLHEQAELERRELAWAFLDAAGQAVVDPEAPGVVAVLIPFEDYLLLLGVLDGWRTAARAYKTAGLFRDPKKEGSHEQGTGEGGPQPHHQDGGDELHDGR